MNKNTDTLSVIKDVSKKLKEEFDVLHEEIMHLKARGTLYLYPELIKAQTSLADQIAKEEGFLSWRAQEFTAVHPEDEYEKQVEGES